MSQPADHPTDTSPEAATLDLGAHRRRRRARTPEGPDDPGSSGAALDPRWLAVSGPGDGRPLLAVLTSLPIGTWAASAANDASVRRSGRLLGVPGVSDLRAA